MRFIWVFVTSVVALLVGAFFGVFTEWYRWDRYDILPEESRGIWRKR